MFDVSAATEDSLEVDPATLHIDPDIKEGIDAVQLVLPSLGLLLKLLRIKHSPWDTEQTSGHGIVESYGTIRMNYFLVLVTFNS